MSKGNIQWKSIAIIFGGLVLVWAIFNQIAVPSNSMVYGQMGANWSAGSSISGLLNGLLGLALNILWLVVVVSLIVGTFQLIKKFIGDNSLDLKTNFNFDLNPLLQTFKGTKCNCPECGENLETEFKFCPKCKASLKSACQNCGKTLQAIWKCCPTCGTEQKMVADEVAVIVTTAEINPVVKGNENVHSQPQKLETNGNKSNGDGNKSKEYKNQNGKTNVNVQKNSEK